MNAREGFAEGEGSADNSFDALAAAQMERLVSDLGRMYRERKEALEEVARAHHEALLRLAMAAEFKDGDTGVHIVRIGLLSEALALRMGVNARTAAMLRCAAPMHDVGKIGVPDKVLKKPGPLDAEERREMNLHAEMGAKILGRSRIPLFQLAADIALCHHERFDGNGYPRGLAGEDIPLMARIVSVVAVLLTLTMDRVYRPAFSDEAALRMLLDQRGSAFDPRVVDAFMGHAAQLIALRDAINRERPGFDCLHQADAAVQLFTPATADGFALHMDGAQG